MSATVGAGSSPVPLTENEVAGAGDTRYAKLITPSPGEIFGLIMSTAGSSTTLSVAAGICADSTNVLRMKLTSLRAKTTSLWAAGTAQGGLDTGTIANSTWYHWYVIANAAGTLVDVIFSTSAAAPALPSGYTLYRRIGSMKTNGSGQWTTFTQLGDEFLLAPFMDNAAAFYTVGTSASSLTLGVPTGIQVNALGLTNGQSAAATWALILSALDAPDVAPAVNGVGVSSYINTQNLIGYQSNIRTNTSAQIRARATAAANLGYTTLGWIDSRGRNG